MIVADTNLLAYLLMPGERTETLSCPLVTGDRELAAAFPGLATGPEEFVEGSA